MENDHTIVGDQQPKFALGQTVATSDVAERIASDEIRDALFRHVRGDWGTLEPEDWRSNESALVHGGRLFSAYRTRSGVKFWIITEADRSVTTVLFPEDY